MCYSSILQFLNQIPTWIIVVVGWYVVHYLSNKRDQRKETRDRLDQFISVLREIEGKANKFHQSEAYKGEIARVLVFDIQRIFAKLKRHPFSSFEVSPNLLKELRQAITLKNFDSSKFSCQPVNSAILNNIANTVDDMEDQLEKEYERLYILSMFRR